MPKQTTPVNFIRKCVTNTKTPTIMKFTSKRINITSAIVHALASVNPTGDLSYSVVEIQKLLEKQNISATINNITWVCCILSGRTKQTLSLGRNELTCTPHPTTGRLHYGFNPNATIRLAKNLRNTSYNNVTELEYA